MTPINPQRLRERRAEIRAVRASALAAEWKRQIEQLQIDMMVGRVGRQQGVIANTAQPRKWWRLW